MAAHHDSSVPSDDGTHCAFFYGTLMVPQVFYSVCYGSQEVPKEIAALHTFNAAILPGYRRHRVKYADYPGITEEEGGEVFGSFVTGLTKANMEKLDYFEGGQYERRKVTVKVLKDVGIAEGASGSQGYHEEKTAEVYVFLHKDDLEPVEWDLEEFRREKLRYWTRAGHDWGDYDPAKVAE
ncbi:hypothetical protein N656DRAFT_799775 [Canariomyces notabilis]|uniref:Putative gamma-glutamylcyclotransferase n=1 Tax=Canariomyces notabilis TaxID=2074819 RepID=A0AAN6QQI8_9PEZI|nr:hypothetical protein N656DRAFT_799775 [Canariomyces arenarius]